MASLKRCIFDIEISKVTHTLEHRRGSGRKIWKAKGNLAQNARLLVVGGYSKARLLEVGRHSTGHAIFVGSTAVFGDGEETGQLVGYAEGIFAEEVQVIASLGSLAGKKCEQVKKLF